MGEEVYYWPICPIISAWNTYLIVLHFALCSTVTMLLIVWFKSLMGHQMKHIIYIMIIVIIRTSYPETEKIAYQKPGQQTNKTNIIQLAYIFHFFIHCNY